MFCGIFCKYNEVFIICSLTTNQATISLLKGLETFFLLQIIHWAHQQSSTLVISQWNLKMICKATCDSMVKYYGICSVYKNEWIQMIFIDTRTSRLIRIGPFFCTQCGIFLFLCCLGAFTFQAEPIWMGFSLCWDTYRQERTVDGIWWSRQLEEDVRIQGGHVKAKHCDFNVGD